jgi:hypothetical protein
MIPALATVTGLAIAGLIGALCGVLGENRELRQTIYDRNDRIEQLIADKVKP